MVPITFVKKVESSARTSTAAFECMFVSGDGIRVRDESGHEYLDSLPNAGVFPFGHTHREIRDAVLDHITSGGTLQALDLHH